MYSILLILNDAQRLLWLQMQCCRVCLLVYYSVFAHTALSKCEDCLCPRNCADGTEGHALCMSVNEWMTVRLRELAQGIVLTLTKVSVYVCVFFTTCAGLSLYLVLLSLLTSGQLAYIVPAATKHPDMHILTHTNTPHVKIAACSLFSFFAFKTLI